MEYINQDPKQFTLSAALSLAGLTQLPKPWTEGHDGEKEGFWTRAIVLITVANVVDEYALYYRQADGSMKCEKTLGRARSFQITGRKTIYPYEWLDEKQFCRFSTESELRSAMTEYFGVYKAGLIMEQSEEKRKEYIRERGMFLQRKAIASGTFVSSAMREQQARDRQAAKEAESAALLSGEAFKTQDGMIVNVSDKNASTGDDMEDAVTAGFANADSQRVAQVSTIKATKGRKRTNAKK